MKKWMSIALVALMFCALPALAEPTQIQETSPFFDLSIELPAGMTMEQRVVGDISQAAITSADKPNYTNMLVISFDDLMTGRDMADLNEAELEDVFGGSLGDADAAQASYTMKDLDDGVKVMIINTPDSNVANVLTIKDGYFMQIFGMYNDDQPIAEADVNQAVQLLDDIKLTQIKDAQTVTAPEL